MFFKEAKDIFNDGYTMGFVDCLFLVFKGIDDKESKKFVGGFLYRYVLEHKQAPLGCSYKEIIDEFKKYGE